MSSANWIVDLTLMVLVLLSIASWSIALIKLRHFRLVRSQAAKFMQDFAKARQWRQRIETARQGQGEFAQLARIGFETCQELSGEEGQGADAQELQEILDHELRKQMQFDARSLERGLAELASIGSTAPFIGVFGTVWGIMNALKTITATGQAGIDVVAGPIGEALIATAIGIATAVPAVLAYNYVLRQLRVHTVEADGFLESFMRRAMRQRQHWGES